MAYINIQSLMSKTSELSSHLITSSPPPLPLCHSPPQDSKNVRYQLISSPEVAKVIGKTRAFDGCILFTPTKITDHVSSF